MNLRYQEDEFLLVEKNRWGEQNDMHLNLVSKLDVMSSFSVMYPND